MSNESIAKYVVDFLIGKQIYTTDTISEALLRLKKVHFIHKCNTKIELFTVKCHFFPQSES